jgi:hypothetical protein
VNRRHRFLFGRPGGGYVASPPAIVATADNGLTYPYSAMPLPTNTAGVGVLVLVVFCATGDGVPVAGWTLLATIVHPTYAVTGSVYWKPADGSTTTSITALTDDPSWVCWYLPASLAPDGHATNSSVSSANLTVPSLTPTGPSDSWVGCWFLLNGDDNIDTTPALAVNQYFVPANLVCSIFSAATQLTSGAATGAQTCTNSGVAVPYCSVGALFK